MAIIGVFTVESVKLYARQHQEMWWIALAIMIVSLISLACCPHTTLFSSDCSQ